MMELICPDCMKPLVWDDEVDYELGLDYAEFKEVGHCPKCEKNFHWYSHFKFSHYEGLTED